MSVQRPDARARETLELRFEMRCTPQEKADWRALAEADNRSLADWLRLLANNEVKRRARPEVEFDKRVLEAIGQRAKRFHEICDALEIDTDSSDSREVQASLKRHLAEKRVRWSEGTRTWSRR